MKPTLRSLLVLTYALLLLQPSSASAVTPTTAQRVLDRLAALPPLTRTSSKFEIWGRTTTLLMATSCWHSANPKRTPPAVLFEQRYAISGVFTLPNAEELEGSCQALAETGPEILCTGASVRAVGVPLDPSLMSDYLQVGSDWRSAKVEGSLACFMTRYLKGTQQHYYTGSMSLEWTQEPKEQSLRTYRGAIVVRLGYVVLTAPGANQHSGEPVQIPLTAIALSEH